MLQAVLEFMNFIPNWVKWIMACVSTIQFTLLVNGSITQNFNPSKGLRQGDLLSPYLFLMCSNILSLALIKAEENQDLKDVKLGRNGLSFTHLLFVDDSLLFFRKDDKSLEAIKRILSWYCSISRQCVNLCKSDLYCSPNMDRGEQEALASDLQVNLVQNPSKYLGINFKLKGGKVADFHF